MPKPSTQSAENKKTARVSLVLSPALYNDVVILAQIKKCSLNDFFCDIAAQAVKKNRQAIDDVAAAMSRAFEMVKSATNTGGVDDADS